MGVFRSVERRQQLRKIAQRYHYWQDSFPGISDTRVLNRLHSERIKCQMSDLLEALEFEKEDSTPVPPAHVPEAYTTAESAMLIGVSEEQFKMWFLPSYAKRAEGKSNYVALPYGIPMPERLNPSQRGKPALFSSRSIMTLKQWLEERR